MENMRLYQEKTLFWILFTVFHKNISLIIPEDNRTNAKSEGLSTRLTNHKLENQII